MQNLLPPLPDATFPIPNLLPSLPDATTQPQIAITQWPFASSRWPFHDNQRTKTSILCSKCLKTRVPNPKSAQKPRFCARNARKQGFPTPKAHKNLDFVLEMPENEGSEGQKSTKTSILCSGRGGLAPGREEISIGKHNMSLPANHRARFQNANAS